MKYKLLEKLHYNLSANFKSILYFREILVSVFSKRFKLFLTNFILRLLIYAEIQMKREWKISLPKNMSCLNFRKSGLIFEISQLILEKLFFRSALVGQPG